MVTLNDFKNWLLDAGRETKEVLTDAYYWFDDRKDQLIDGYNDMSATDLHRVATRATLVDIVGVLVASAVAGPVGSITYGLASGVVNTTVYLGGLRKAEQEGLDIPEPFRMEDYSLGDLVTEVPKRMKKTLWNPYG